jgi:hypothetical protein
MQIGWLVAAAALLTAGCAGSTAPAVAPAASSEVAAADVDRTVDCPPLTRMKYPFLTCVKDAEGHVVFDAEPEIMTVSQMPPLDPFVESDEYWGD